MNNLTSEQINDMWWQLDSAVNELETGLDESDSIVRLGVRIGKAIAEIEKTKETLGVESDRLAEEEKKQKEKAEAVETTKKFKVGHYTEMNYYKNLQEKPNED